jgi:oligogalacturonide transport system permease protein
MKKLGTEDKRKWIGLLYIMPWFIGFMVFKLYPFMSSLVYSFTDYHLFRGVTQFGFDNYKEIFGSSRILEAFNVTFKYAFITVPLKLVFALFIAYILNFRIKAVNVFRTVYYIPSILGGSVSIAVLWKAIFKNDGIINTLVGYLDWLDQIGSQVQI